MADFYFLNLLLGNGKFFLKSRELFLVRKVFLIASKYWTVLIDEQVKLPYREEMSIENKEIL
jgi:hypothetical protein